jgi:hypothetical protein
VAKRNHQRNRWQWLQAHPAEAPQYAHQSHYECTSRTCFWRFLPKDSRKRLMTFSIQHGSLLNSRKMQKADPLVDPSTSHEPR